MNLSSEAYDNTVTVVCFRSSPLFMHQDNTMRQVSGTKVTKLETKLLEPSEMNYLYKKKRSVKTIQLQFCFLFF